MSSFYMKPRYRAILKEADLRNKDENNLSEPNKAKNILSNGVFLKNKHLFYWLEEQQYKDRSGKSQSLYVDCYVVLAPGLTLTDQSNDSWSRETLSCEECPIMVAKLEKPTRWLEVKGEFSTVNLQLYSWYQVSFLVKLSPTTTDNDQYPIPKNGYPINLSLVVPNRNRQEIQETISSNDKEEWRHLAAGKFYHTYWTIGTIYFSLKNVDSLWKNNISILGVYIKPRSSNADHNKLLQWKAFQV